MNVGAEMTVGGGNNDSSNGHISNRYNSEWLEGQSTYFHRPANEGGQ